LKELPDELKEIVPEITLAGHVFSQDPALRLIMVNNKIAREGDIVVNGYLLEEITMEGVIFKKGSLRFKLAAK
jgi:general secretion pathway protein B